MTLVLCAEFRNTTHSKLPDSEKMVPVARNGEAEMEDVFSSCNSSEKSSEVHSSANNPAPPESTVSPARNTVEPGDGDGRLTSEKPAPPTAKKEVGIEREAAAGLPAARQGPARTATGKTPLPTLAPASQTPPTSSESASDVGQEAGPDARVEAKAAAAEGGRAEPEPDAEAEADGEVEAEGEREHPATDSGTTTNSSATSATSSSTSIAGDTKATHVPASSAAPIVVEHVCS